MFEFLVMAQREHERLGVTLADSHQKQPAHGETNQLGWDRSRGGERRHYWPSVESTRLLVPAGG